MSELAAWHHYHGANSPDGGAAVSYDTRAMRLSAWLSPFSGPQCGAHVPAPGPGGGVGVGQMALL